MEEASPAAMIAPGAQLPGSNQAIDMEAWRNDLQQLHVSLDQIVQAFISTQGRQMDAVAAELAAQREQISAKELCFVELSDSVANFVEAEAAKMEIWGVPLTDIEAEARHEAYDADLPGPPVLHRINRLWRKTTRTFEAMNEAKEREVAKVLEDEKARTEALVAAAEERCQALKCELESEIQTLKQTLDSIRDEGQQKDGEAKTLALEVQRCTEHQKAGETRLTEMAQQLEAAELLRNRAAYEWDAEREELKRGRDSAMARLAELDQTIEAARQREADLVRQCAERGDKLEQMKRVMDDQEREMTMKIDRVQHYVKERQAGALQAEQKQKDAERMADRWQREVQRLQAEKDRLAALVLDLETHKSEQARDFHGVREIHENEVSRLRETLRKTEEDMRSANMELLHQRDSEYQAKVNHERQREKDRSIALLKKKEQEVQIKEQQLKAARQRIQEFESAASASTASNVGTTSPDSSRGSSVGRRSVADATLPRLPMSAR